MFRNRIHLEFLNSFTSTGIDVRKSVEEDGIGRTRAPHAAADDTLQVAHDTVSTIHGRRVPASAALSVNFGCV